MCVCVGGCIRLCQLNVFFYDITEIGSKAFCVGNGKMSSPNRICTLGINSLLTPISNLNAVDGIISENGFQNTQKTQ